MPIDDNQGRGIAYKIVYYGAPGAGKTTNLERISTLAFGRAAGRLRPAYVGENRIASVELPLESLERDGGPRVRVRLETIQGDVSGELGGWSRTLSDADGIVFVVDSSPRARTSSFKALSAIREKLEGVRRTTPPTPALIQWNKRDLIDARAVAELETELNPACVPSIECVALRGKGVTDTLLAIFGRAVAAAQRRAGGTVLAEDEIRRALTASIERLAQVAEAGAVSRYGSTIAPLSGERHGAQERPTPRYEVVESREMLFSDESPDAVTIPLRTQAADLGVRPDPATRMFAALEGATRRLSDASPDEWPDEWLAGLLAGCGRIHGSLLLFRRGSAEMDPRELVPPGSGPIPEAASLCSRAGAVVLSGVHDPAGQFRSVFVVPLANGDRSFGGLFIHQATYEPAFSAAEQDYWKTVAALAAAHLARQSATSRPVVSRPVPAAPSSERAERREP